jgi:acyl transferase domain-containing protein
VAIGTSGSDLGAEELSAALARAPVPGLAAEDSAAFGEAAFSGLNPLWLLLHLPNMASAHVAIQVEARGPNTTVMTGRAAGLQAVVEGAEWIREGRADAVLAGGADAAVHAFSFAALEQAGLLRGPSPFVPAEGAAVLLLEERDAALARGAPLLAELEGHALGEESSSLLRATAPSVPAPLLERLVGNLLAAHSPAALVLAIAEGLDGAICASASGPFGEACSLVAVPGRTEKRNAA